MYLSGVRVVVKDDHLYITNGNDGKGNWYEVLDEGANLNNDYDHRPDGLIRYAKSFREREFARYKTGGVADFTGPAWLDGTPSKPEYVLNSA
jgi:hypothetical protein